VNHFSKFFLGPVEEEYYKEEEEDDGLGYYKDGVKRTLTDEQIAIFRHSEIEELRRNQRHAEETKEPGDTPVSVVEEGEIEANEVVDTMTEATPTPPPPPPSESNSLNKERKSNKKEKKAQKARERGWFKQNIKPDLRKRTWDKVDTGMESLDYDEENSAAPRTNPVSQRRRISYLDD